MPSRHRALPGWLNRSHFDGPLPGPVPTGRPQETSIIGGMLTAAVLPLALLTAAPAGGWAGPPERS
jgi:hypothetical protein